MNVITISMRVIIITIPEIIRLWGYNESLAPKRTAGFRNNTLELIQGTK